MKSNQSHTVSLIRSLFILSGVLLLCCLPSEADNTDVSLSNFVKFDQHFDSTDDGSDEDSPHGEPVSSASIFDLVLKEASELEQATATSYSLTLTKQGNNLPEADRQEFISGRFIQLKNLLQIKDTPDSNRFIPAFPRVFSFLLSLSGDIAINAP